MVQGFIFDMDGVLVDSEPIYFEVNKLFLQQLGVQLSTVDFEKYVGCSAIRMWTEIREEYRIPLDTMDLIALEKEAFYKHISRMHSLSPIPGIVEFLKRVQKAGFSLSLASSSARKNILKVLEKADLDVFFPLITSGEDVENGKPSPDIFLLAAVKSNLDPKQCVVIEDSFNGVTAAKSAGMTCVGFQNLNSGNQNLSKADLVITNFSEKEVEKIFHLIGSNSKNN